MASTAATPAAAAVDWRNVNEWHWAEKDCREWARDYLSKNLIGISVQSDSVSASTVTFIDSDGDVSINTRKGKIITLFDLCISFRWRGKDSVSGVEANGKITIPELMHDSDMNDITFDFDLDASNPQRRAIEEVVRRLLPTEIRKVLSRFGTDLYKAHTDGDSPIATVTKSSKPAIKKADAVAQGSTENAVKPHALGPQNMATVRARITFNCPPQNVFNALLEPEIVQMWTRSPAVMAKPTGAFSLFNGNITGEIKEAVESKKISMTWRLKSWPADHVSTVVLEFDDLHGSTSMSLVQVGVPSAEKESTETNWERYYWRPIKETLGY